MLTEKQNKLRSALYEIFDVKDFVMGIGCTLQGDDEVQRMIDFINSGEWDGPSDLTVKALLIAQERE